MDIVWPGQNHILHLFTDDAHMGLRFWNYDLPRIHAKLHKNGEPVPVIAGSGINGELNVRMRAETVKGNHRKVQMIFHCLAGDDLVRIETLERERILDFGPPYEII